MSEEAEKTRRLIAFKKKIETRIEDLEAELKEQQTALELVNSILLEKGFRHPEIKANQPPEQAPKERISEVESEEIAAPYEPEGARTLKSGAGETLAQLYVDSDVLHVVLAEDKAFKINTPPFNQFLVQRVLLKMQERDSELVRNGQLDPDKILCFDIIRDGDIVREILIRNFDSDRLRELSSSIRWTLEKMLEKTSPTN
jgi:uncharacterized coiled-coil protein SlyX